MRRHQFEAYLDKVFDWTAQVATMAEGRQNPTHPWPKVFDAVFLASACQFGPVHRVEAECRDGVLHKRIGPLSEDTVGYALQRQSPEEVLDLGCLVARQLKRNGVLRSDWARGRVVAAVDGIEICSSYCRCCEACLERTVARKVDGKLEEWTQYYHRLSAVTVVSTPFPIFVGIRFQKSGETEVACSLALLQELVAKLGKRFVDILVADALYLQTPFVRALESLGLEWVINLKDNQPDLAAEAERLTNRPADYRDANAREELELWHLPEVDWPVADRLIGVVKTGRVQNANRVAVRKQDDRPIREKQPAPIVSTNYYATNVDLGAIPPFFIHQLGRSRWVIDARAFQTITTDCHLKQPSVHQSGALVVLTMIRVLAYTLAMVFYFRQVRSHARTTPPSFCQMARQFGYAFLTLQFDSS
ncbi:MAG: transposase [Proteobacteria bacterium]|nr:transposase [Pseudomonadota bacterium]